MTLRFLPYGRQEINGTDVEAVVKVLLSDFLTQGPVVEQFEDGRYDAASRTVDQLLEIDPKNRMALSLRDTIESIERVENNGKK